MRYKIFSAYVDVREWWWRRRKGRDYRNELLRELIAEGVAREAGLS